MVAIYMGIEDTLLVHHKGLVFQDRGSSVGPLFRTVGTFGDSLSMYLGAGHGRFSTLHNELDDLSHRIALLVGMNACRQPMDLLSLRRGTLRNPRPRNSTAVASISTTSSGRSTFLAGTSALLTRGTTGKPSA